MMSQGHDETIARWSDDPAGLPQEECARRGIEAVAGLVIQRDMFGTNHYPDAHFCACAEFRHVVTGAGAAFDDHIAVGFRAVEIRNGTYPMLGPESVRMLMQPLGDGRVSARWDPVGAGRPPSESSLLAADLESRANTCRPMELGDMPEQAPGDVSPPSFLFLKDPGAGWQIWRRFSPSDRDGQPIVEDGCRVESYAMVYPLLSQDMNWRFRVYDLPGGGVRWEVDSRRRI